MKLIPLSKQGKNKGKYFAIVDDVDYEWLMQWRWSVAKREYTMYAQRKYVHNGKNDIMLMHRQILGLENGDNRVVDHKNHNGFDCRRSNIRICTTQQNNRNRRSLIGSFSKYLGVSSTSNKHHRNKKWRAIIKISKEKAITKYYHTEIEAAIGYNELAKKYFGEFANLNKI